MGRIAVTSGYGANTHEPFVELRLAGQPSVQLPPDNARQLARHIFEAAEAAEQDAFMVEWGTTALGEERAGTALLMEYRRWRAEREAAAGKEEGG